MIVKAIIADAQWPAHAPGKPRRFNSKPVHRAVAGQ